MGAIRELLVKFDVEVDNSQLQEAAKGIDGAVKKVRKFLGVLAAATGATAFGAFIKNTADAAAAAGDLAQQVGLTAESFQVLQLAAFLGGATVEDLRISLKSLAKNALLVTQGSKTMVKAFKDLNVEVTDANGNLKGNDVLLLDVAASLSNIENPTERVARAQTVLGEASLKLLPALSGTREELQAYVDELRGLGGGFSKEAIASSRQLGAAMLKLRFVFQSLSGSLVIAITPAVESFSEGLIGVINFIKTLTRETKILRNLFSGGLFIAFKRLLPLLTKIRATVSLFGFKGLAKIFPIVGKIGKAFAIAARFVRRFILPFLIFDDIFTFLEGGDTIIGRLIDALVGPGTAKKFQEAVASLFKGITSFLSFLFADDPEAKAKALKEMNDAFAQAGAGFKDFFGTVGAAIIEWLVKTGKLFGEAFGFLWDDFLELGKEAISKVVTFGTGLFSNLLGKVGGLFGGGGSPPTVGSAGGARAGGTVNQTNNNEVNQSFAPGASPGSVGTAAMTGVSRGSNNTLRTLRGVTQG